MHYPEVMSSPECDVYVSRLAGLETLSYSWSRPCQLHLKKAVAVDENPSHAIELQAPHLNFKYSQQRHNGTEDWVILPK